MKRNKRHHPVLAALLALVLVVGLGFFAVRFGYGAFMKQSYPQKYTEAVEREAAANSLPTALVYAVIRAESSFDPKAHSGADAYGLMQITPDTFDWLQTKLKSDRSYSTDDLFDPDVNIRYGCKFLRILLDKYAVRETALAAYNAGMGNVNSWLQNSERSKDGKTLFYIPFKQTEKYVVKVEKNYQIYRDLYDEHTGEIS